MKPLASVLMAAFILQDPICEHADRGASKSLDLASVRRAHASAVRSWSETVPRFEKYRPEPFDSGLPACRTRNTRRHPVHPLPETLPSLYFAPAGTTPPTGSHLIATSGRSRELIEAMADGELVRRLGVRCTPTLLRKFSTTEVELVEGD